MFGIAKRVGLALVGASVILVAGCTTVPKEVVAAGPFSAPQIAAMEAQGFKKTNSGWEFSVNDRLLFATDSADVMPAQVEAIGAIARRLVDVGILHAEVQGHTDRTGSAEYNEALSVKRAAAVAEVMKANGMARDGVKVVGLGARYPVESNGTAAGRRENRRVVILITAP